MRPSRYLAVLALIFIVLFSVVFFGGSGKLGKKLQPKLGLDLVGGTTVTLIAQTENGQDPSPDALEQARQIIEERVNALGVAEPSVVTEGQKNIVISIAGESSDAVRQVGVPAELRFRKVLKTGQDLPTAATATPTPSGGTPSPGASGTPTPKATTASPTATPKATTPAATTPVASPSASASGNSNLPKLDDVVQKLGAAYQVAGQITDPSEVIGTPSMQTELEPFRKLSAEEVAVLPAAVQFNVPEITCDTLNKRPAGSIVKPDQPAVACSKTGGTKYMLDVAKVLGTDVSSAAANLDTTNGAATGAWKVDLSFTGDGQKRWTDLTKETFNNVGNACTLDSNGGQQHCLVAVVLDNLVVSAPEVQAVQPGDSQITGSFSRDDATLLANELKYGALPLTFTPGEAQTISATLGTEQLKAGLLAAGIGMLLVVVYAFFYYRLLGTVIFLSLILSGLLTYGMLVLLGRGIGFTLTLAGIAGFIVSLGVAADSFVIYFERLKDEIREGRSPRSAVPRAWVRARRTIITANVVSILAAAILYFVGVGSVRQFAFALGLATLLDLIVVFLFRHPVMTMLARQKAFLSPRVSGLGRVLQGHEGTGSSTRVKEA
jgi:preprotein translocase subunit SecD